MAEPTSIPPAKAQSYTYPQVNLVRHNFTPYDTSLNDQVKPHKIQQNSDRHNQVQHNETAFDNHLFDEAHPNWAFFLPFITQQDLSPALLVSDPVEPLTQPDRSPTPQVFDPVGYFTQQDQSLTTPAFDPVERPTHEYQSLALRVFDSIERYTLDPEPEVLNDFPIDCYRTSQSLGHDPMLVVDLTSQLMDLQDANGMSRSADQNGVGLTLPQTS